MDSSEARAALLFKINPLFKCELEHVQRLILCWIRFCTKRLSLLFNVFLFLLYVTYECFESHISVFVCCIVQRTISRSIKDIRHIYFALDFVQVLDKCICLMLVTTVDELEHELFLREISTNAHHICASYSHDPSLVVRLAISCQALVILSFSRLS